MKFMNDSAIAKAVRITQKRENWLIKISKSLADTKIRIKKATAKEEKEKTKLDKVREKV